MSNPKISVLVVAYNMKREAPRTIETALPPYQKAIGIDDYEVLVLDNGSSESLPAEFLANLPSNVRFLDVPNPNGAPGAALNWGVQQASSDNLMFCIDGARMFSDQLVAHAITALGRFPEAFVYTFAWHLGPDVQMRSVQEGYNQKVEDELLKRANWREEPDNLFGISVLAGSSSRGLIGPISESNAFCMSRDLFDEYGGYDLRFRIAGGSTSNLEIFKRYVTRPGGLNICLLSEGTFHQVHGGAATSNPDKSPAMFAEYEQIFGEPFRTEDFDTMFYGRPRAQAVKSLLGG